MAMTSGKLRKSIATVSLGGTLPDKLDAIASAGFDGLEITESDLLTYDGPTEDVRQMAEGLGLTIDLYQPFRDFEAAPAAERQHNLDRAERKFDVMQTLGTKLLLVCSNTQPSALDDDARAAADLAELAERAARRGLRIGYEALSWARHVKTWRHAWKIIESAAHPALGLVVDSFDVLATGDDPSDLAHVPGERIFHVQLADAIRGPTDLQAWSRHFRLFPGQGELDVIGFLRAVLASGYAGPLGLEVFNDGFRAGPAGMTARDGLRALLFAEAEARGSQAMPAAPVVGGIEFVEFAVDQATGAEMAALLGRMGFRHAGQHRSKSVDLYRQGRINLVLNSEQDSAAAEHFHLHGPSVCATALRVDDVPRTLARAAALQVPEWTSRIGTGERRIPAIRGVDGTLFYLIPNDDPYPGFWQDDFHLIDGDDSGAGLLSVDHFALAVGAGRMESHILFWRSLFGLALQPTYELPDPYGMVCSRAVVDPTGNLRLSFNISDARETTTNRFLSTYFGGGVHHVAFAARDAGLAVERLRAAGAPMLEIPPIYYEDLSTRFGIDDAVVAELARLGLLFDSEGGGEYRQAYTESFQHRFFFEVVERRGGYSGLGAVNAPVRMAAQARAASGSDIAG